MDPLEGAGDEHRAAALSDDPAELRAVQDEYADLDAETLQLAHRRDALKRRLKRARDEEERAQAPERDAELMDWLLDALDRVDAALFELAEAMDERDEIVRRLDEARELAGGKPYWSPELLRRLWAQRGDEGARPLTARQLRERLSDRDEPLQVTAADPVQGVSRVRSSYVAAVGKRLGPPEEGVFKALLKRVRSALAPGLDVPDRTREEVRREADRVRARLIAEGNLDRLSNARSIAEQALQERYSAPGRRTRSRSIL